MPNLHRCTICHHALPEGAIVHACRGCAYQLRAWLREFPLHLPLLHASLERDGGPAQRGGNRAHAPLPLRTDVLDLLGPGQAAVIADPHGDQTGGVPIAGCLLGWARYLAADYPALWRDADGDVVVVRCDGPWPRQGMSIPAWCVWLSAYVPYAVTRPWVGVLYDELETLVRRTRAITGTEPRRSLKLAPCPQCRAFALLEVDGRWYIECQACPARLTRDEYADHARQIMPGLTTFALWMVVTEAQHDAAADEDVA